MDMAGKSLAQWSEAEWSRKIMKLSIVRATPPGVGLYISTITIDAALAATQATEEGN